YVFCNQCGHRNPPDSSFCSSCGSILDRSDDHTVTIGRVDPLQDAPGAEDDIVVRLGDLPRGMATLVMRNGPLAGTSVSLSSRLTRIGRHSESELQLDDVTVSRRHAEIERVGDGYVVRDDGSLNGTYVNGERVDEATLQQGDEVQVGKFRLIFFSRAD
ncbi:MAG: FHA domain-containing protein, partial [Ilumatobacteraceae bacterium]